MMMEDEREFFHGSVRRRGSWELEVILHSAVHIDLPLPDLTTAPSYYVCARVDERVRTTRKRDWFSWANVVWEERFTMEVSSQPSEEWLYLELVREGALQDPGSSTGQAVVGRAVVPLITSKKLRVPLHKPEGSNGGYLFVTLKLRERVVCPAYNFLP
ncbi:hypothetical protein H6P81_006799 [Aristolochia fimbriata]|uniref:C2 domain-containing protein n=1 Tax=Aristolochia fimbriata TaxID=158543 RepID=A0AAV7F0I2_ARIFI|nr:hypothetical protein H6P81_006799 [Aristolochia fimbriata]